jgi:hypothetical protein
MVSSSNIHSFIHFPVVPIWNIGPLLGVSVITHTIRHMVGLLWMSDQTVAEASTCTGRHNIEPQETNINAPGGI